MNSKVQLNDMELNQVAGGGLKEAFEAIKKFFEPKLPITPIIKPCPRPDFIKA